MPGGTKDEKVYMQKNIILNDEFDIYKYISKNFSQLYTKHSAPGKVILYQSATTLQTFHCFLFLATLAIPVA